ncbi:MAG: hypothetical protein RMM10_13340, partial [Anaerolineae bacterium]|uniref:hypothetical protein n=1 Tax=Thermoflexus sp. TaxID=1969742 RepID=UPI0025FE63F1
GVQWVERFAGASPEVLRGVRYLERIVNNPNVPVFYRRGVAAELLRAEQRHRAGKLKGVEVQRGRDRVDFVLITDEVVEFKDWTRSYTERHIQHLANQLLRYQRMGLPLILELAQTQTDPITKASIEWLLRELRAAGVSITRDRIRLIRLP